MADFENNVALLATVRISERSLRIPYLVASDLVDELLRIPWGDLPEKIQHSLVDPHATHLLEIYQAKLRRGYSHKQAARQAMTEEHSLIEERADSIKASVAKNEN